MQNTFTGILLTLACLIASNTTAQRYFKMEQGKQVNFHASDQKFIAHTLIALPKNAPVMLNSSITIDSSKSLGNTGLTLLHISHKAAIDARQLQTAGRQSKQFDYITPVLLTEDGKEIGSLTDRIMVKLKSGIGVGQLSELLSKMNASIARQYAFDKNVYFIQLPKDSVNYGLEISYRLLQTGLFQYAEPDYLLFVKGATNDPFFNQQWSLNNTRQRWGFAGDDIKATAAWDITTGCNNIRVAVLDIGVELNHPDLQANLLPGFDATGGGSAGGPNGDNISHGTNCTGIIGAVANNGIGTVGIAYNCRILPVRIFQGAPGGGVVGTAASMAGGIDWAWQQGADVLSCSWSTTIGQAAIQQAITNAVTQGRGGRGAIICVATGNANSAVISFPASDPDVIAVGASSPCDQRKSPSSCDGENWGSNYGPGLDVVAPGVKIYTTDLQGANGDDPSDYDSIFNGTSSATPHVAATAALIFSVNPDLPGPQARRILETTVDKVGGYSYTGVLDQLNGNWNNEMGYGRINAFQAVLTAAGGGITGDGSSCGSATYNIYNLPTTATGTTWSISNASIASLVPNGNSVTVNTLSSGTVTLYADVAVTCGTPMHFSKTITLNTVNPSVPQYTWRGDCPGTKGYCANSGTYYAVNIPPGVTYQYSYNNSTWTSTSAAPYFHVACDQSIDFYVRAVGCSGNLSPTYHQHVTALSDKICHPGGAVRMAKDSIPSLKAAVVTDTIAFKVYPVPATTNLKVSFNKAYLKSIKAVKILNIAGVVIQQFNYGEGIYSTNINVSRIKPGMYIIQAFDGVEWLSRKIIIQ